MELHKKAAVFIRGARKYRDVKVDVVGNEILVSNTVTGAPIATYFVDEVAKDGEAWDVTVPGEYDEPVRLVVQAGCGCGGQKPYEVGPDYSGKLKF